MGLTLRWFGMQEKAGSEDEVRGLDGVPYLTRALSPEKHQSENTPTAAWVETHPTNSADTRSRVESPAPKTDYTRHVVTVEVHPVPYNKPKAESSEKANIK